MKERLPAELIFFVTSRCHLRCKHCFNWNALQRNEDLSLSEIRQLAKSLPGLKVLSISGGEPFLRKDLAEICQAFVSNCRITFIDIPTSGTLIDTTLATVEEILRIEPSFNLAVGVSIDGMEAYHDANRGVPGTFSKAVECCKGLLELKKKYPRLSVNVLTTLVQDNKDELLALKKFVGEELPEIDDLSNVVARGDVKEGHLGDVSPDDLACIDREFREFNKDRKNPLHQVMMGRLAELRREAYLDRVQPVPCVAGRRIAVVYDDGGVAPCELLPSVGNLRSASFEEIWHGEPMRKAREAIAARKCACTHECFLGPSYMAHLLENPLQLLKLAGLHGLQCWLYEKCAVGAVTANARKIARRLRKRQEKAS